MKPETEQKIFETVSIFQFISTQDLALLTSCKKNEIEKLIEQKLLIREKRLFDHKYVIYLSAEGFKKMWERKLEEAEMSVKQAKDALNIVKSYGGHV